ncbi:uncharacterized protein B0T15DRAFT_576871 [Chaetomium strumarium]|uniref:Uncharacterized protein n=1 Tax=Chaetomium strumarium TaxID=1170767 RepID=A0AAJ0GP71_9PEZI|nr:hypothetical protein B0T15DRAFT_576871 [Chaetomium strumarium]
MPRAHVRSGTAFQYIIGFVYGKLLYLLTSSHPKRPPIISSIRTYGQSSVCSGLMAAAKSIRRSATANPGDAMLIRLEYGVIISLHEPDFVCAYPSASPDPNRGFLM